MRTNKIKGLAIVGAFLGAFAIAMAANNIAINGAGGARYVMKTTEGVGGVHTLHVNVDTAGATVNIGSFNQESVLAPITATTGGVSSAAFTAGKAVIATNVGATNMAYCRLGAASSTSGQPISPNGGWFAFQSIAETQVTCVTSTSTTVVNFSVGTGLPTGTGGGGGGSGGGGSVTQGTTPWVVGGENADDAAASGNPVATGGIYRSALPTYSAGDRTTFHMGTRGSLSTQVLSADGTVGVGANAWSLADAAVVANINGLFTMSQGWLFNGTTADKQRSVITGMNSVGTGIGAVGPVWQYDDTGPVACTENQFCPPRQSANRNVYMQIRDATSERSVTVDSNNALKVVGSGPADGSPATLGTDPTAPVSFLRQDTPSGCDDGDYCHGRVDANRNQAVAIQATRAGGCTPRATIASTATTNAASAVAAPNNLCEFTVENTTTTNYFLHLYNTAGSPTCNASIIQTFVIPAASAAGQTGGLSKAYTFGLTWTTGLGICITSAADGTGNAAAGVYLNLSYKS